MKHKTTILFGILILFATSIVESQVRNKFVRSQQAIPNQYIVVLKDDVVKNELKKFAVDEKFVVESFSNDLLRLYGGIRKHVYAFALRGFSVQMSETSAIALSQDSRVEFVEEDAQVSLAQSTQNNAPWGLDRIDQRDLPLNGTYRYTHRAETVNVFIIDTGILYAHTQFEGRASSAFDAYNVNGIDDTGHGTHVAGIIGGKDHGVAKRAKLFSVKVFRTGFANTSIVISGIDWVTQHHNDVQYLGPDVANLSFELPSSNPDATALDTAVRNMINGGVISVVAAGNNGGLANDVSPARVQEAITVSATNANDFRVTNYNSSGTPNDCYAPFTYTVNASQGSAVDLFAPGHEILSASKTSITATCKLSGTSMSAAFVSGMAALFLSNNPSLTPAAIQTAMKDNASVNKVVNIDANTPNRLEYVLWAFSDVPPAYWAKPWIEGIFFGGVTGGCATSPLRYCPSTNVTRGQMAVFLLRSKFGSSYQPPPATGTIFADVPANHMFAAWIEDLYLRQITGGCGTNPLRYCPENPVSRGEMAVFLLRTKYGSGYQPPAATGIFADVPVNHMFAKWIEQLYREGITGGCATNPLRYCPNNTVTRDQMAVLLALTFNIPL